MFISILENWNFAKTSKLKYFQTFNFCLWFQIFQTTTRLWPVFYNTYWSTDNFQFQIYNNRSSCQSRVRSYSCYFDSIPQFEKKNDFSNLVCTFRKRHRKLMNKLIGEFQNKYICKIWREVAVFKFEMKKVRILILSQFFCKIQNSVLNQGALAILGARKVLGLTTLL